MTATGTDLRRVRNIEIDVAHLRIIGLDHDDFFGRLNEVEKARLQIEGWNTGRLAGGGR